MASRTATELGWDGAQVLEGELPDAVRQLKAEGSGTLAVLGSGKRLFRDTPRPLRRRLIDCTPTTTGVLLLSYAVVRDR